VWQSSGSPPPFLMEGLPFLPNSSCQFMSIFLADCSQLLNKVYDIQMFVFFHIPKTAGTTFRELLVEKLQPIKKLYVSDVSQISYISDEQLNSYDFVSGHVGTALLARLKPDCKKLTMLRDPLARTISQYQYLKKLTISYDVASDPYGNQFGDNTLKQLLEGTGDVFVNGLFRNTQTWSLVCGHQQAYRRVDLPDHEVLAIAKENLEGMDFFGIVEKMESSLALLNQTFGLNVDVVTGSAVVSNPSSFKDTDYSHFHSMILENNQLDVALYAWAVERFEQRVLLADRSSIGQKTELNHVKRPPNSFPTWHFDSDISLGALSIGLLKQRVADAEMIMSSQSKVNKELRAWAEQSESLLQSERKLVSELKQWAEGLDEALTAERDTSRQLREWAERTEIQLRQEREKSKDPQ
jgi:Sulfotransferase family